MRITQHRGAFA